MIRKIIDILDIMVYITINRKHQMFNNKLKTKDIS